MKPTGLAALFAIILIAPHLCKEWAFIAAFLVLAIGAALEAIA